MNANDIVRRVNAMVPGLESARIEQTKDRRAVYFLCTLRGKSVCAFAEVVSVWLGTRTDEQIAVVIAKQLEPA